MPLFRQWADAMTDMESIRFENAGDGILYMFLWRGI